MAELGNMTGGEMAGAGAFVFMLFKMLIDSVLKIMEKLSPNKVEPVKIDPEEIKWKTNLSGVLDETRKLLEKMNDKGDTRAKTLDDIHGMTQRDHRNLGEVKSHMNVLTNQIAGGDFCNFKTTKE